MPDLYGEKREHLRVTPRPDSPIIIDINGENFVEILHAQNISIGGISVFVPHGFQGCEINKQVNLVIKLPKPIKKSFCVAGKIKHLSHNYFGVDFIALGEENRTRIEKYIAHMTHHESWRKQLRRKWVAFLNRG